MICVLVKRTVHGLLVFREENSTKVGEFEAKNELFCRLIGIKGELFLVNEL